MSTQTLEQQPTTLPRQPRPFKYKGFQIIVKIGDVLYRLMPSPQFPADYPLVRKTYQLIKLRDGYPIYNLKENAQGEVRCDCGDAIFRRETQDPEPRCKHALCLTALKRELCDGH